MVCASRFRMSMQKPLQQRFSGRGASGGGLRGAIRLGNVGDTPHPHPTPFGERDEQQLKRWWASLSGKTDSKELRDLSKVTELEGFPGPKGGGVWGARTAGDCKGGF